MRRAAGAVVVAAALAAALFFAYEYAEAPASQLFGATLVAGPAERHVVALTFDDGPNPPYTNEILRVLERERVSATFFVVGRAVAAYPSLVAREARDGDAIGNHSWSHGHLVVMTPAAVARSLQRTSDEIARATGERPTLMRPPFGKRDWIVLAQARRLGLVPVMWSVPLAGDWENPPATAIARRILRSVRNGAIIVLHDGNQGVVCSPPQRTGVCDRRSTVEATALVIGRLKARGYRFVTVPELLAMRRDAHSSE